MSEGIVGEWREATLGEFVRLQRGHDLTAEERKPGDYPVMGSAGPNGTHGEFIAHGPGVVIGRSGASMGKVHFMPDDYWPHNTCLYVTDFLGNDPRFAFYLLGSHDLASYNSGSAQPSLNRNFIYTKPIRFPLPTEQRAIARILGTLDDKIELDRKQNETLEAMARALFKAWFVDFEPVRAKLEGRWQRGQSLPGLPAHLYDLFPDRLVESELGEIPEGWRVARAGDIYDVGIGKTPPRKEQHWFTKDIEDMPWASIKDMGDSGLFIGKTSEYLTSNAVDAFNIRLVPAETVLLSFKLTVGRLAITDSEMTTNEAIAHFKSKESSPPQTFLWCYLRQFDFTQLGSTSSIATATNSKAIREMPILQPSKELVEKFDEASSSLFQQIRSLQHQSHSLAQLRDTLLPKLISGELRVSDAQRMASSATGDPVSI